MFGAGKGAYLTELMNDIYTNNDNMVTVVQKLQRSHERTSSNYSTFADMIQTMSLQEPDDATKQALRSVSQAVNQVEDHRNNVIMPELTNHVFLGEKYTHLAKDSAKDVRQRDKLLESIIDLHAKYERLRFQPQPNHKVLYKTKSSLEIHHNDMLQMEDYINRRHADVQKEYISDMKMKMKRIIKIELNHSLRAMEEFSHAMKYVDALDPEHDGIQLASQQLRQFKSVE